MQSQNSSQAFGSLLPGQPFVHSSGELPGRISYRYRFITIMAAIVAITDPKNRNGNLLLNRFSLAERACSLTCLNDKIYFMRSKSQNNKYKLASNINVV